jgi:hypothetical protein
MNVPMPRDNQSFVHALSLVLLGGGIISLIIGFYKKHDTHWTRRAYIWIVSSIIFTIAVGLGSLPWLAKNFNELGLNNVKNNPLTLIN